jgi:predicted adenine nucleotide alpha hydrolase (AANH) superfamily ATPase
MKNNYQLMLDRTIEDIAKREARPSLLLHACCAPCSSYVLEYLSKYFDITLFFYNPNISPASEHDVRLCELERLVRDMGLDVDIVRADYEPQKFLEIAKGLENLPEASERCRRCYELRLDKTARAAAEGGFDYFTTTLSISPHKNAEWLNQIGRELSEKYEVAYLFSDFKKRGGYKRSCELSAQFGLYRQDYCGCAYSKAFRENQKIEGGLN